MLNRYGRENEDATAILVEGGREGARERKTFGGGVASLDACNQFRTARAITVSVHAAM